MVAIITKKLKKLFIQDLLDQYNAENIGDSNNYYYIGLSKSQPYNVEIGGTNTVYDPDPSDWDERSFRMSLQSVKLAEAVSFVVPIETWSTNTKYFQYADNLQQDQDFMCAQMITMFTFVLGMVKTQLVHMLSQQ
jgi:hypothetical protein